MSDPAWACVTPVLILKYASVERSDSILSVCCGCFSGTPPTPSPSVVCSNSSWYRSLGSWPRCEVFDCQALVAVQPG